MRDSLHASWIAIGFVFIRQCFYNTIRYLIGKNLPFHIIDQIKTVIFACQKTGFDQNGRQLIILQHLDRRKILIIYTPILRIAQRIQLLQNIFGKLHHLRLLHFPPDFIAIGAIYDLCRIGMYGNKQAGIAFIGDTNTLAEILNLICRPGYSITLSCIQDRIDVYKRQEETLEQRDFIGRSNFIVTIYLLSNLYLSAKETDKMRRLLQTYMPELKKSEYYDSDIYNKQFMEAAILDDRREEAQQWYERLIHTYDFSKNDQLDNNEVHLSLARYHPVSYTHLDVYKRQPSD